MHCYVAGIVPISTTDLFDTVCTAILFAGSNYRSPHTFNSSILDFKESFMRDVRDIKQQIEKNVPFIDCILFCGGEPTLQRQALLLLAKYAKEQGLKVAIQTNGTKPNVLRELMDAHLVDHIILELDSPLEKETFSKVSNSATFFVTSDEIMNAVRDTLQLMMERRHHVDLVIRTTIVPNLMYRKEQILELAYDVRELDCEWQFVPFFPSVLTYSDKLKSARPPTSEFLRDLKKACLAEYPDLRIQIKRFESA